MRLAIIADIHGNLPALQTVTHHMETVTQPDEVIVAGDLVNLCPFSSEVVQFIQAKGWPALRGNHAYYALDWGTPRQLPYWRGSPVGPWMIETFGQHLPYLATLPDEITLRYPSAAPALVLHGTPGNNHQGVFPTSSEAEILTWFEGFPGETIITAHTHLPIDRRVAGLHIINPGAVGLPYDGDPRAAYCIIEGDEDGWQAEHHRVAYDRAPLLAAFEEGPHRAMLGGVCDVFKMQIERAAPIVFAYTMFRRANFSELPFGDRRVYEAFREIDALEWFSEPYKTIHNRLKATGSV